MDEDGKKWAGKGWSVLKGSAGTGRVQDTAAVVEVPVRGQGGRDTDR